MERIDTGVEATEQAWAGFAPGNWTQTIDVRDFIQQNYTPYEGDAEFLAGPTDKTLRVWDTLSNTYLKEERIRRVYDVDTHTPVAHSGDVHRLCKVSVRNTIKEHYADSTAKQSAPLEQFNHIELVLLIGGIHL